jgi:hypothetical protein
MVTSEDLSGGLPKTRSAPDSFSVLHFLQWPLSPLRHDVLVRLDVETPVWRHQHGIRVIHRRRARLEDERP